MARRAKRRQPFSPPAARAVDAPTPRPVARPPQRSIGARLSRWAFPAFLGVAAVAAAAIVVAGLGRAAAPVAHVVRPVEGSATAPVTIAEYSDFQCDYCGQWARTVEPELQAQYIDTGIVRFEWHDMAWEGPESEAAANAARCAGDQGQFWAYHDLLYRSQGPLNSGAFSAAHLKAFGAKLGLDTKTFDACVDANTYGSAIQADLAAATQLGINGTPTFIVNGQRLVGDQPLSAFAALIGTPPPATPSPTPAPSR